MQYVEMGDGVRFSRIIQGFWRLTGGHPGDWGMSTQQLVQMLGERFSLGVTTLDSAEGYGNGQCEVQLGKALAQFDRSQYQVISKAGICLDFDNWFFYYDTTFDWLVKKCRESVEKLGCGYLDMFLIHREDPMLNFKEAARAFAYLKSEGLIKAVGVSNFDPYKFTAMNKAVGNTLRTNQIELHPCCFEHFNSGMLDLLQSEQIPPIIWSPMAGGRIATDSSEQYAKVRAVGCELAKKYDVTLNTILYAWILNHPVGALPIVGSRQLSRVREAVDALELKLDREDWYRIYAASGQQKIR